jgi:hypothetical protein
MVLLKRGGGHPLEYKKKWTAEIGLWEDLIEESKTRMYNVIGAQCFSNRGLAEHR